MLLLVVCLLPTAVVGFVSEPAAAMRSRQRMQVLNAETQASKEGSSSSSSPVSLQDRIANSGAVSAAAMATAAVNAAVSMKTLEAPEVKTSFIALNQNKTAALDDEGLPLVYDKELIEKYWTRERGALNQRWSFFVSKAIPFLTKLVTLFIRDGKIADAEIPALSRQARIDIQELGPTFIKAGQMMSVRPDVLPTATLEELRKLQDAVIPFDTKVAIAQIERELGGPLGQFFTSISEEPVAAASLAQVYRATLKDGKDTPVAIKVQRPSVLGVVSKDLYVLRRAAEVFQGLVERFAPQQRTDYVALLNEWAIGFYTELDFSNEAANQVRLRESLQKEGVRDVVIPKVYTELCTRRLLVSEWIDGTKLSDCSEMEINRLTKVAQEAFLTQLFTVGFFHSDPHPGNLLRIDTPREDGAQLAIIDCGLMARIDQDERDKMISAVIHLANKDYASLVDDFINLKVLPPDTDRPTVIPLMDKALSPYLKGGGAKKYEAEVKKLYGMDDTSSDLQVGAFQAMTRDALTVLNDVPFSIPPYFAILGRAIVTLEGIALTGDPTYGIIMESYPFIARKLLSEDRPEIQRALQDVLYRGSDSGGLKLTRLLTLLNNAAGTVAESQEGAVFVDLDAVPEDGLVLSDGLQFLLSDQAESLRNLLEQELDIIVDLLGRQILRNGLSRALVALAPPRPPSIPFVGNILPASPPLDQIPLPFLLPTNNGNTPSLSLLTLDQLKNTLAPKLSPQEEIYVTSLTEAAREFFGNDIAQLLRGEGSSAKAVELLLSALQWGTFGTNDILTQDGVKSVIRTVSSTVGIQSKSGVQDAISNLTPQEKDRLDAILFGLVQRGYQTLLQRLETGTSK